MGFLRLLTMDQIPIADMKFEAALAELEDLVRDMEGGALELEASIANYRRGVAILKHCREQLSAAETQIRILEDGELKEFEARETP